MENQRINAVKGQQTPPAKEKKDIFSKVGQRVEIQIDSNIAIKYLPRVLFMTFLGVLYIANVHYSEKMIRRYAELQKDVEILRVDFSSMKYEYINASKPGEMAKRVSRLGLQENDKPLFVLDEEFVLYKK
jgi:Bacteriodetes cell division protein (FtsL-like)